MEIIKGVNNFEFIVLRSFLWRGKVIAPGEKLEISNPEASGSEVAGLINIKKLRPVFPLEVEVVALKPFSLSGNPKKFECKAGEKLLVLGTDLLELILNRWVLPTDDAIWRPFSWRFKKEEVRKRKLN